MGSGGGGGGGDPSALTRGGVPMPGLPVAGADSTIGNPYEYGQFQSFLPEIKAEGMNDMATGLRPDMFQYKSPTGVVAESGNESALRDALAKLTSGSGTGTGTEMQYVPGQRGSGSATDGPQPSEQGSWQPVASSGGGNALGGAAGAGGAGGYGGGYGGGVMGNGFAPPPGATELPTPQGGWFQGIPGMQGGPGTAIARPGNNPDPTAAAAALAALKASGG